MNGSSRPAGAGRGRSILSTVRAALITGLALTVPVAITLFLLFFVVDFIASFFDPIVAAITTTLGIGSTMVIGGLYVGTFLLLLALVALLGLAARTTSGQRAEIAISNAIEGIPGIGAVYASFNEMSELLLDSDTRSFREVVLVEYPTQGSYAVAFLTAETPAMIRDSTGHDAMRTVYVPMSPNPVMGGFVMHVADDRVYDVEMSVEEGIQSIVTSGVALGEVDDRELGGPASTGRPPAEGV